MYTPFLPEYRGGRGHPPAHPPEASREDRQVPRRHQPALLRLTEATHSLPDGGPDWPMSTPVAPPRATLIDLAADPRFARVRTPIAPRPSLRGLLGKAFMNLGLRLLRSQWPG